MGDFDLSKVSDEELSGMLREQVNRSRFHPSGHDRRKTRAIAEEAAKRGWNLGPRKGIKCK